MSDKVQKMSKKGHGLKDRHSLKDLKRADPFFILYTTDTKGETAGPVDS